VTTTVPPKVLAEWRSAEERLYPVVMLRPDLYQRSIELVRKVADELAATCSDIDALVAAWPEATDLVYRVSALSLLPLGDLDVSLVAGAAFSLRYREQAMTVARAERIERVQAAVAGGDAWVELEQTGTPETAAFMPYARLEMHVPSGRGLRRSLGADPDTGKPVFGLETLRLDRGTGDVLGPAGDGPAEEFGTRGEWEAAIEMRRREIEAGG
jgi:hypothetical protein